MQPLPEAHKAAAAFSFTIPKGKTGALVGPSGVGKSTIADLLPLLADPTPFAPELLPDTGFGPERERLLSPLFITGEVYGTRCTTVLLVSRDNEVTFAEQGHDQPDQPPRTFTFRISP